MVISPGHTEGFTVIFFSNDIKKFTFPIKYTINYKNAFKLKVIANVVPVNLKILSSLQKFSFKNEKFEKVEMSVTQNLKLYNEGNAPARIRWEENKMKCFSINPKEAIVQPKKQFTVEITFSPLDLVSKSDVEDELKCLIENGTPFTLKVVGNVPVSSVSFFNLPNDTLNFDFVHIGVPHSLEFSLKNDMRNIAAYLIVNFSNNF